MTRKIQEMQGREQQLLDQLSFMKDNMKFQTSQSEQTGTEPEQFESNHLNLRIGELETIIFQQREQILQLQDETTTLRNCLEETNHEKHNKLELYELRNQNLQELNRKYEGRSIGHSDNLFT